MTESLNLVSRPHILMLKIWSYMFVFNFFLSFYIAGYLYLGIFSQYDDLLRILTRNWKILPNHPLVLDLNPPLSSFQSSAENWRTLILDLMYAAGSY